MKQIKLLLLLASASVTGALAQSNGLTDMSQSRFAKMVNTGIGAVHWTNGFWGDRFNVFSQTSLQSMWNTWNEDGEYRNRCRTLDKRILGRPF